MQPCSDCKQPLTPLTDRLYACACQNRVWESVGAAPLPKAMSPALRNHLISMLALTQQSCAFASVLVGTGTMTLQIAEPNSPISAGNPRNPNEVARHQKCGQPYHQIFDQYLCCKCPGMLHECAGTKQITELPMTPYLRNTFLLVSQVKTIAQRFAVMASGAGDGLDASHFGVTHFGGRG